MDSSRRGASFGGFLVLLLIGGAIGAAAWFYVIKPKSAGAEPAVEQEKPSAATPADENYISRKLREWNLTPDEIKRDLGAAGEVVREKGRELGEKGRELGQKIAEETTDVRIIAKIKAKYALDDHLRALDITVGCKAGRVTLSGTVAAPDLIGRAIVLALDTDGVVDVVSSLKVRKADTPV